MEIKYEIVKRIAIIGKKCDWNLELNLISWNDKEKKFDLRKWDKEHIKMSKGITLSKDEMIKLKESINLITSDEVKVNVISCGVGSVNETDVDLAKTTNSIIICFNNKADNKAKDLMDKEKVEIYYSKIIYDVLDYLTNRMKSMFTPKFKEVYAGKAEVRVVYKVTNVGVIAGSYVLDGKIARGNVGKVIRNGSELGSYTIESLKIKKDDAKEVGTGFECGIKLENFTEIQVGDIVEVYSLEKIVF